MVETTGAPVAGVPVRLTSPDGEVQERTTGADGRIQASDLVPGLWLVTVMSPDHVVLTSQVEVHRGRTAQARLVLMLMGYEEITVLANQITWREVDRGSKEPAPSTVTGTYTLTRRDMEQTPGSLEDVTRAVMALPGVVSDGGMSGTFHARGAASTDVVFLLDRVPIDNPFHLAGFNSLFNPDMTRSVTFHGSASPATVPSGTGAVVSVLSWDGTPKDGSTDLDGAVDISMFSARGYLMGPIDPRGKLTFAASARRTYLEAYLGIMKALDIVDRAFGAPEYSDLNLRMAWHPHPEHTLTFSGVHTSDSLRFEDSDDLSVIQFEGVFDLKDRLWLGSVDHKWERERFTWQTTAAVTNESSTLLQEGGNDQERTVGTTRFYARTDLTLTPDDHVIALGADVAYTRSILEGDVLDTRHLPSWRAVPLTDFGLETVQPGSPPPFTDVSIYAQEEYQGPVRVRLGGRLKRSGITGEWLMAPSAGVSLPLMKTATIPKLAWGVYHRVPRDLLAQGPTTGIPDQLRASTAVHLVGGLDQGVPLPGEGGGGMVRLEGWGSFLHRQLVNPDTLEAVATIPFDTTGHGWSSGVDLMVSGRAGPVNATLTYGLLFTERTNPLNTVYPNTVAPPQDQRHTLGVAATVEFLRHWNTTLRYSFHTGRPASTVVAASETTAELSCLNCERLGDFHNLDWRLEWSKKLRLFKLTFYTELLNVTNAKNDFVPTAKVTAPGDDAPAGTLGTVSTGMFQALPIRPFMGVRADF